MNKIFFIILFQFGLLFSQNTKIDKNQIIPREIGFKGCVKKLTINNYTFNKKNDKIDTVKTISEINFSKTGNIQTIKSYNKLITDFWRVVEFDHLGRIDKILIKDNNKMINYVNQYYSNTTEFPDSTLINLPENYKERYINHFKNDLVIKQDHYVNNSLQDYRVYKYNDQNQLIEDLYLNPENVSGETVVFKGSSRISFYPESLTLYEYGKIKDTIITTKKRPKSSLKEVTKKLKTDKYSLEMIEKYNKDCLEETNLTYTFKDSISNIIYNYKKTKR